MTLDRILALLALITLAVFLAVIPIWVPLPDLLIVIALVVLLAIYDFYRDLGPRAEERHHREG